MGMYSEARLNAAIDRGITEDRKPLSDRTSELVGIMIDALKSYRGDLDDYRSEFAKFVHDRKSAGASPKQLRAEAAEYQFDADERDIETTLTLHWLKRLLNMPAGSEETVSAAIEAVFLNRQADSPPGPAEAIKTFKALAAKDDKIVTEMGLDLVRTFPGFGSPDPRDEAQIDRREIGKAHEGRDKRLAYEAQKRGAK